MHGVTIFFFFENETQQQMAVQVIFYDKTMWCYVALVTSMQMRLINLHIFHLRLFHGPFETPYTPSE